MMIKEIFLGKDEYYHNEYTDKDTIVLHHTAGSHRPDNVVSWWNKDNIRVATHYIIGGISTRGDSSWDGKIIRCMSDDNWAHHIGLKAKNNIILNKKSIGIEICNWGPLTKKNDLYYNYLGNIIPENQVYALKNKFRGYLYYHKYTENQIESLKILIDLIADKYNIDKKAGLKSIIKSRVDEMPENITILEKQKWLNSRGMMGIAGQRLMEDGILGRNTIFAINLYNKHPFDISKKALDGIPGIYTHTNYRKDKSDCHPQDILIDLLEKI